MNIAPVNQKDPRFRDYRIAFNAAKIASSVTVLGMTHQIAFAAMAMAEVEAMNGLEWARSYSRAVEAIAREIMQPSSTLTIYQFAWRETLRWMVTDTLNMH